MKNLKYNLLALLVFPFLFATGVLAQTSTTVLHILYTQNNNGKLENCHCPSVPLGGFEKRSTFLKNWFNIHPNTLLFDSGDFLAFEGGGDKDLKVLDLMDGLDYTAVNIGDQEFSNGSFFFESYILASGLPLISSNLMFKGIQKHDFKRFIIISIAGIRIAVTGVVGPENVQYFTEASGDSTVWCVDPQKALQIVFDHEESVRTSDLHILLSNLGFDKDVELAKQLSFLDVIVGGHSQHKFDDAVEQSGTLIMQCGKDGHYVGHLEITIQDGKISGHKHELIPMGDDLPDDNDILKRIREM